MASWVIGDQPDTTGPEGVVDILDVRLDLFGGILQQLYLFLLFVMRLHHLCDVTSGCHHTMELPLFVTDRTEDGFVVTGTSQIQVRDTLVFSLHLVDVGDG